MALVGVVLALCVAAPSSARFGLALASAQGRGQDTYPTPDAAVAALVSAIRANDRAAFSKVAGDALAELSSGDTVQDNLALLTFAKRLLEKTAIAQVDDSTAILYTGSANIPLAIPIVKRGGVWYFDVAAGKGKMLASRVAQNEGRAIALCRLFARAERDYMAEDRDGDGVLEYAQKFVSSTGQRDGLFWPSADMSPESPLGAIGSLAKSQGYVKRGQRAEAFQGYYFRILTRQGLKAPEGSKDYVVNGNMTGGFACVAYPARWGYSGVMTFLVGPDGTIREKNLGENTAMYASAAGEYNPDETWVPSQR